MVQTNLLHQNPDVFPTERYYPEERSSYDKLRHVVKEAWEAVGADELLALVREMPARCEAVEADELLALVREMPARREVVIDAQGGYTKY
jgi:hypothetical protein